MSLTQRRRPVSRPIASAAVKPVRRERTSPPKPGSAVPLGPVLPDTNAFISGLTGRGPQVLPGGGGKIATARAELISDALTAILAARASFTMVTEDADFDVLAQPVPGLHVLFYDRHGNG